MTPVATDPNVTRPTANEDTASGRGATDPSRTEHSAPQHGPDRSELVSQIANAIGRQANVSTVFGEPVYQGDVAIIPVASVAWGFGGGQREGASSTSGNGHEGSESRMGVPGLWRRMRRPSAGRGGGGGARLQPMGYILVRNGDAEFRPIQWFPPLLAGCIGALVGARLVGRMKMRRK